MLACNVTLNVVPNSHGHEDVMIPRSCVQNLFGERAITTAHQPYYRLYPLPPILLRFS